MADSKRCVYRVLSRLYNNANGAKIIRELHAATRAAMDNEDQSQRGTQLLEIYALEIQMHNEMRNVKKLKVLSFQCRAWSSSDGRELGNLQCFKQCPLRDPTSAYHGGHQRMWRQNVDG